MSLPAGFMSIADARKKVGDLVSLIGVPVDFQHPKKSRGKAASYASNLLLRMFKPVPEKLPQDIYIGDDTIIVIVIKKLKIGTFNEAPVGMSHSSTKWVILKGDIQTQRSKKQILPQRPKIQVLSCGPDNIEDQIERSKLLSLEEYKACEDLMENWHARGRLAGCHGEKPGTLSSETNKENRKKKLVLIKEIQSDCFHDIICFVQDKWSNSNTQCTLYVSDFTPNMNLMSYSNDIFGLDETNVQEPFHDETYDYAHRHGGSGKGKKSDKGEFKAKWFQQRVGFYTLEIICWDSLAVKANDLKAGDYIILKNVLIKKDRNGNKLEGALRLPPNSKGFASDGLEKLAPNDIKVKALNTRRNELEKQMNEKKDEIATARKRREEEQKQKKFQEELSKRRENNPLVHCGWESMETTTIDKINNMLVGTGLDFTNRRYRTECRIAEFRPQEIEDFCQPVKDDEEACSLGPDVKPRPKWYWCFEIDVVAKDETSFLTIHVDDAAGRYLLSMDPCDLRAPENRVQVEQLRHELFILWGNLEEVKRDRRDQLMVVQNHLELAVDQLKKNPHDKSFQEAQVRKYHKEAKKIRNLSILEDPKVDNKFFFAMVKEYGEPWEDDGDFGYDRKFILEHTAIKSKRAENKERHDKKIKKRLQRKNAEGTDSAGHGNLGSEQSNFGTQAGSSYQ
ncbi:hypothetical protein ABW21_db0204433 [Orbilia brochopaga]|nr:hypothetical protein ABW21_db0204433 [Drechslerella brochopaga]